MSLRRYSVAEDDGAVIRCSQTNGRRWQCPLPALPNHAFCNLHRSSEFINNTLTGSDPEALKRVSDPNVKKRKREKTKMKVEREKEKESESEVRKELPNGVITIASNPPLPNNSGANNSGTQKKKKKKKVKENENDSEIEVRKELPNGVITIASNPPPPQNNSQAKNPKANSFKASNSKANESRREKVEVVIVNTVEKRKFRSKNVERNSVGSIKLKFSRSVTKDADSPNKSCGTSMTAGAENNGIVPAAAENIGIVPAAAENIGIVPAAAENNGIVPAAAENNGIVPFGAEYKEIVPTGAEDNGIEEQTNGQVKSTMIEFSGYSVRQLLPILEQPNWDQIFELDTEANHQGKRLAGVQLQVIECSNDAQFKCNYCRSSIVNFLRSCSKCNYKLCLKCCREIRGESFTEEDEIEYRKISKTQKADKNKDEKIMCPPSALGGCGDEFLNMKSLVPVGWKKKPETSKLMDLV